MKCLFFLSFVLYLHIGVFLRQSGVQADHIGWPKRKALGKKLWKNLTLFLCIQITNICYTLFYFYLLPFCVLAISIVSCWLLIKTDQSRLHLVSSLFIKFNLCLNYRRQLQKSTILLLWEAGVGLLWELE